MKGVAFNVKGLKNVDFDKVLGDFRNKLEDLRRCL